LADCLCEFALAYPHWLVPWWAFWRRDRTLPCSWKHYVYGLTHLRRASARESLRLAQASAVAQSRPEDFRQFCRETRMIAYPE